MFYIAIHAFSLFEYLEGLGFFAVGDHHLVIVYCVLRGFDNCSVLYICNNYLSTRSCSNKSYAWAIRVLKFYTFIYFLNFKCYNDANY